MHLGTKLTGGSWGSDPVKWLFLKRYGFKKRGFLGLSVYFFGAKKWDLRILESDTACWVIGLSGRVQVCFTAAAPP